MRFKAFVPNKNKLVFGDDISDDLMFLNDKASLKVIDTATRFSSATILDIHESNYGQSTEEVWVASMKCWCTMYTTYPPRIRFDQGFVSMYKK